MTKVDLITGFLGEGKTTFLQGYADFLKQQGESFAVLENEFGAAGVDASLLKQDGIIVRELSGGCICCTLPVGFHDTLVDLSEDFDRILVEPSGIFDPKSFFEIMQSPNVAENCEFGAMIAIVDPHNLKNLSSQDRVVLAAELQYCGQIVLSKIDEVDQDLRRKTAENLRETIGEHLEISETEIYDGIYPVALLSLRSEDYARLQKFLPVENQEQLPSMNHAMIFQSTTLYPQKVYSESEIEFAVNRISTAGIITRAKGYVKSSAGGFFVNYTPSGVSIEQTELEKQAMINVIGRELNRDIINNLFS